VSFLETVERARTFLERHRRVSLRALRREFDLDPETLAELSDELVQVQHVAVLEGDVLVWTGEGPSSPERDPRAYTPSTLPRRSSPRGPPSRASASRSPSSSPT